MEDGGQLRLQHSRTRFHKVAQHLFPLLGLALWIWMAFYPWLWSSFKCDAKVRSFQNHYINFLPYPRVNPLAWAPSITSQQLHLFTKIPNIQKRATFLFSLCTFSGTWSSLLLIWKQHTRRWASHQKKAYLFLVLTLLAENIRKLMIKSLKKICSEKYKVSRPRLLM